MSFVSINRLGVFTPQRVQTPPHAVIDAGDVKGFHELDRVVGKEEVVLKAAVCSDGRVFSLARQLRKRGFVGTLILEANMLPDQLPMAISCGVDQIVISGEHARRCTEPQWRMKAEEGRFGYQRATARSVSLGPS